MSRPIREETWFIMGSVSTGFFIWMALWDVLGLFNAFMLGVASIFFTYTIASAPRSLHTAVSQSASLDEVADE